MTARTEAPLPGADREAREAAAAKHEATIQSEANGMLAAVLKSHPSAEVLVHVAEVLRAAAALAEAHAATKWAQEREREAAQGGTSR